MTGPWKHPGSGIYWFRRATPKDIFDSREALGGFGIAVTREVQLSLRTRERREAERQYGAIASEWQQRWDDWRAVLRNGPITLSHKQIANFAGSQAKAFVEENEDNPHLAAAPAKLVAGILDNLRLRLGLPETNTLHDLAQELLPLGLPDLLLRVEALLAKEPEGICRYALDAIKDGLATYREVLGEALVAKTAQDRGVTVSAETKRDLGKMLGKRYGDAWQTLAEYRKGNYAEPEWMGQIPPDAPISKPRAKVTFQAIIDAQAERRAAGEGSKPMPAKSIKKYSRIAEDFAHFRGSDDATTVTASEVEEWADTMIAAGEVSNRTIGDRLVNLGTIINWGKRQRSHREAMTSAEAISGSIEMPSYQPKAPDESCYTVEEARKVLLAARKETVPEKRWLHWLCLYAGLRIGEALKLTKADFYQVEGKWFLRVTTAGRRSLKTPHSERRIPVHPALIAEGLITWVQSAKDGQLFSLAPSSINRWVRSPRVGITRPTVSPNHGMRHLFKALCERDGINADVRKYLTGHAMQEVHAKYGSADIMLPGIAEEMERIKPILPLPVAGQ